MTSTLYRWQAAMGAIAGSLVADALVSESASWTPGAMRSVDIAESMLAGVPVPIDLEPHLAVVVAVGLASGSAPLLLDSSTVEVVDMVRAGLGNADSRFGGEDSVVARAAHVAEMDGFGAVSGASGDVEFARLVGGFAGLVGGVGAVPARLVSTLRTPDGRRGRRYLCGLTNRLLGVERPQWYDPRTRRGPREVLPGLWVSNLHGLSRFTADHPEGLVLSLCDEEGRIAGHHHHVTFHLEDTPRTDANPSLSAVIDDVLGEIAAARSVERPVLVHCRHGASRTGLVLRALLVEELGLTAEDALVEAQCIWPHTSDWNRDWTLEIERRAGLRSGSEVQQSPIR